MTNLSITDVERLYQFTVLICGVGLTIGTLEYWYIAPSFSPTGLYPWDLIQPRLGLRWLNAVKRFHVREVRRLLLVRAAAVMVFMTVPYRSALFSVALAILIASTTILRWRTAFDEDGSDRMNSIVLLTLFLCAGPHTTPFILHAGLWFLALHVCLAYATSGIVKLRSQAWRRGEALYRILSTKAYGLGNLGRWLQRRRWLRVALSWFVMLSETLFPLCLLLPSPALWVFLACCSALHVVIAAVMGFNTFVWAFAAAYPAVVYAASELTSGLS